jgi:hypothetical protein
LLELQRSKGFGDRKIGHEDRKREVNANRILRGGGNLLGRQRGTYEYKRNKFMLIFLHAICVNLVKLKINIRIILCRIGAAFNWSNTL